MNDAVNRVLIVLVGLGAIAAGALGVATTLDAVGEGTINGVIPFSDAWDWWTDIDWGGDAALWALLGGSVVVALLALAAVIAELRPATPGNRNSTVERTPGGRTRVRTGNLARALSKDVSDLAGVRVAEVESLEIGPEPAAVLRIQAEPGTELAEIGRDAIRRAAGSLGAMLDRPSGDVRVEVDLHPGTHQMRRKVR